MGSCIYFNMSTISHPLRRSIAAVLMVRCMLECRSFIENTRATSAPKTALVTVTIVVSDCNCRIEANKNALEEQNGRMVKTRGTLSDMGKGSWVSEQKKYCNGNIGDNNVQRSTC